MGGLVVLYPLGDVLYHYPGNPPKALIATVATLVAPTAISFFGLIWMASSALLRFETRGAAGVPLTLRIWTLFVIAALGIGIWFIYGRVKDMLSHPIQSDTSP